MASSGRIDISGQGGLCDSSELTVSRSMPAVLSGRMLDSEWKSFCDKMDEALEPASKGKRTMTIGLRSTGAIGILLILSGFITFGMLATRSVNSFGESTSPFFGSIIFVSGMAVLSLGSMSFICYGRSEANKAKNGIRRVCEETSARHRGISFHVRDDVQFLGYSRNGHANVRNTNYVEVSVSNNANITTPLAQGYASPSAPLYPMDMDPEVAVVAASAVAQKSPAERLKELDQMKHLLTNYEYEQKRAEILSDV
mmetsp:Transcript_43919/g.92426  ORF Transcript_43919/g.92426 Transcript_43919/m.92426 type:complete len:255 (+) Transcript_43919:190-954(+)|eukprot:CAMPEP_0183737168 /NCGR_PEP_ID=MMETSP0737-20130205/51195_1 /TAXON_ID=385413 /ORGANISM="Thalassiosira miniscula, Strain CCMP1093" /LENGTH=254 /DNA_ID=CAMNT_0025971383 /DNA_START=186 /DNA_END=950 /DNA_ORIENTATION=+